MVGKNFSKGLTSFKNLETTSGRGEIFEKKIDGKNIIIVDDSYNASVLSMRSGIEYANSLKQNLRKNRVIVALGDMLELGKNSVELHKEVIKFLEEFKIDFAVLVGKNMTEAAQKNLKISHKTFLDSSSASLEIKNFLQDEDVLYIKGSRGIKMEKIIENLINKNSAY
jgi:UDP-N-acetylmuramoyl-tripeptide--D-alanyl-D-alanine ligase